MSVAASRKSATAGTRRHKGATSRSNGKAAKPGTLEVILVGSALADTGKVMLESGARVHTRHMKSIDDLLAHIENHKVEFAVVDQSKPTESRGLKLALLAAARQIGHLVVVAEPKNCAEAEAIHGVHEVLRAPALEKDLINAVKNHACTMLAPMISAPQLSRHDDEAFEKFLDSGMPWIKSEAPPFVRSIKAAEMQAPDWLQPVKLMSLPETAEPAPALAPANGRMQQLRQLAGSRRNRFALSGLAALLGIVICFAAIVAYFMTSQNWSVPARLTATHPLVTEMASQIDALVQRKEDLGREHKAALHEIAAADSERLTAEQSLETIRQTVAMDLKQTNRMKREAQSHISRLNSIISAPGNDDEMVRLAGLQSMHQLATVTNELAMKRIEGDRLEDRASFLVTLAAQLDNPAATIDTTSGDAGLAFLARDAGQARATSAAARQTVSNKSVEAENLASEIDAVTAKLDAARSTPLARAGTTAQTVLFVPAANTHAFAPGTRLESCRFVIAGCAPAGTVGERLAGDAKEPHPLFGNPVTGHYVAVDWAQSLPGATTLIRAAN